MTVALQMPRHHCERQQAQGEAKRTAERIKMETVLAEKAYEALQVCCVS